MVGHTFLRVKPLGPRPLLFCISRFAFCSRDSFTIQMRICGLETIPSDQNDCAGGELLPLQRISFLFSPAHGHLASVPMGVTRIFR
jgi:hypothetical protein